MDTLIIVSLEKNHSVYPRVSGQDLDIIVWVIKWLSAVGMPAMKRGILYIPPRGVRGNLWHIPAWSPNSQTASSCWAWLYLKENYKVGGDMGVVCFDCVVGQKDLVFLQIFSFFFFFLHPLPLPPHLLFAFLLFVCLFFNIRTLDFACPWKTLWLNRNNNMGVKAEKWSGKGFCKWGSPSILQKDLAASAIANTVLTAEHWIIWPWTCADTQPHTLLVGSLWRCHRVSLIPAAQAASIRRVSRRGWSAEKLPPSPGRKVMSKRDLCCCFASCSYGLVSAIRGVVAGFCSSVSCLCSWEGFKRLAG